MNFLQKSGIFLIILLLIVSVYKDLTSGSFESDEKKIQFNTDQVSKKYKVIKVKVQSGDTVLSIMEEVNNNSKSLDITKLLSDFNAINDVDPHNLRVGHYYYFPLYNDT
ncbi:hypothetical protein [Virgibacillus oceani]|uniref:LysM domain-containing protein n=1 Tax=Virgibacillus oceani TaxID=1479511 RepID=A0A917LWJ9_9BACI|nr:hypothetical protein [Virgibacillus oceani]GGG63538.1 hypothetical protein GCM10011398_03720 [Virgibacillus oceani]